MKKEYLYFIQVGPRLYKIGITKKLNKRFKSISEDTEGFEDVLIAAVRIRRAYQNEQRLHDKWGDKNEYMEDLQGNGGTEVFKLTWLDVLFIKLELYYIKIMQVLTVFFLWFFLFASVLGYIFFSFYCKIA
jgi:hypothetical protein